MTARQPDPATPARPRRRELRQPRDPLEYLLAAIWEEALGVSAVGIDDAFSALGGDDSHAGAIARAVEAACGVHLAPDWPGQAGTVRALGEVVKALGRPLVSPRWRAFPARPAAVPFFFLHGDPNGGGFYCGRLAQVLGTDVALHVLAAHGPCGPAPFTDVPAMVAFHLETLRAVQPHGPYRLGGFCLGGILAFEMARQLSAQGELVERVVMIAPTVWSRFWPWRRVCGWFAARLRVSPRVEEAVFFAGRERAQGWFARWDRWRARRRGLDPGLFPPVPRLREWPRDCWNTWRGRPHRVSPERRRPDLRRANAGDQQRERFWAEVVRRARLHVPSRWDGPTLILWPQRDRLLRLGDPQASWSRVAARLEVRVIPGGHCDCVVHHVAEVARGIREGLGLPPRAALPGTGPALRGDAEPA